MKTPLIIFILVVLVFVILFPKQSMRLLGFWPQRQHAWIKKNQSAQVKPIRPIEDKPLQPTEDKPVQPTGEPGTPLNPSNLLFYDGFESGAVSSGWTHFAISKNPRPAGEPDPLAIVTDPVRSGRFAAQVTVRKGDAVHDGDFRKVKDRAEAIRMNEYRNGEYSLGIEGSEGADLWYAWSVFIPTDYEYTTTGDNFQIMGQWHGSSLPGDPPNTFRPPISVAYRSESAGQFFRIRYGLQDYGHPLQEYRTPIEKGKWIDLMFHIKFSQKSDGFLAVWKNGELLQAINGSTRITGANMYNAAPNYLRLGLYRGYDQKQTNTLYYDEVKIGLTKESISPPA